MLRIVSWYARVSHNRPWLVLCLNLLWILALSAATILGGMFELDQSGGEQWLIFGEEMVERYDAMNQAQSLLPGVADESEVSLERSVEDDMGSTTFIYTAEDNMFTPEGLRVMKEVEEVYFQHPAYKDLCLLQYNGTQILGCAPPFLSLLAPGFLLPEATWDGDSPGYMDLSSITQQEIDSRLQAIIDDPDLFFKLGFFFDSNFGKSCEEIEGGPPPGCTGTNLKSKYTKSMMHPVGLPLKAYAGKEDSEEQEKVVIESYMKKSDETLFELLGMSATPLTTALITQGALNGVEVIWLNGYLSDRDFGATVNSDLMWAAASLVAVFCYMTFHTKSLMISAIGMAQVIFSFLLAVFASKGVFQVGYMDMMVILIIFVTLGIGADDVFVFVDTFKQSEAVPYACGSLLFRIEYTLERASKAVFITSLTTMLAFFMTSTSDLINIQAFGVVAGMNIFFLFTLNMLLMPPAIVIWSKNFAHLPFYVCSAGCLCCGDKREEVLDRHHAKQEAMEARAATALVSEQVMVNPKVKPDLESGPEESNIGAKWKKEAADALKGVSTRSMAGESIRASAESLHGVEKFFNGRYMDFLMKVKYGAIALFLAVACVGVYYATFLAPPTDTEAFLPAKHMSSKLIAFSSISNNIWTASDQDTTDEVTLVWGITGMDISGRAHWDPADRGTIVWASAWKPFSKEAQKHLLTVCPAARSDKCAPDTIGCATSPIPGDNNRWLVRRTPQNPQGEGDCWVEDMQAWLQADGSEGMPLEPEVFEAKLREFYDANPKYNKDIGYVSAEDSDELVLRYLSITFPSTFASPRSDSITRAVMAEWKELEDTLNANAPVNFQVFYTGSFSFVWVFTQESLVYNAVTGLGFVFAIAFVVINLATLNLVISVICTGTIAGIVVTVLGVGAKGISDWDFGMAESIATVILIGFSMDYCLHIAGAYIESEETSRVERTRDALTHLGVSVFAGAITTALAGLFLWATVMLFFQKFAFLITFTVLVSFFWAILFLPALLLIIGPQGDFGNWKAIFRCCLGRSNQIEPLN